MRITSNNWMLFLFQPKNFIYKKKQTYYIVPLCYLYHKENYRSSPGITSLEARGRYKRFQKLALQ